METKRLVPHLSLLSGLTVLQSIDKSKGSALYEFVEENTKSVLASTYTYKKAKCLANGIDIGRKLSKQGI